jgi:hypothetical protein
LAAAQELFLQPVRSDISRCSQAGFHIETADIKYSVGEALGRQHDGIDYL